MLANAASAMREGLQVIDREWRYVYVNAAAAAHGRSTVEALLGRTMMECYPGIDQAPIFGILAACMDGGEPRALRNVFEFEDGVKRTFELRVAPCEAGVMVLSIDVTETLRIEQQLRHAQKMEAIGRLAGSIAHDFNNLLTVILTHAAFVLEDLDEGAAIREDLEPIRWAGKRAADLTRQLLAFSRHQANEPRLLDLNATLAHSEKILRRLIGADVELVYDYGDVAGICADPGQIDQIVMNLAINARDAMPRGGKLTIETRSVEIDEHYVDEHFGAEPGPYVMLAVSDTGMGMDRETQARIFEPYFTTKEPGKGTGLGLSTVFGIVRQNGGMIWVYSEPDAGTSFKIYFPRASTSVGPPAPLPTPLHLEGTETVLVVEDHQQVRAAIIAILRRFGYEVIEALDSPDALRICEAHPEPIHLLLTDVVMPELRGPELAERALAIRPELRVVFMSGYTDASVVQHGVHGPEVGFVQKPISPRSLATKVRAVLDAGRSDVAEG
ncbi:MAG: response regulator [Deltaproteobacteria bacterium]|nr:MAG: response regulator [Deltaproteobacteria bacterium]